MEVDKKGSTGVEGYLGQGRTEGGQKRGFCRGEGEGKGRYSKSGFGDKFYSVTTSLQVISLYIVYIPYSTI